MPYIFIIFIYIRHLRSLGNSLPDVVWQESAWQPLPRDVEGVEGASCHRCGSMASNRRSAKKFVMGGSGCWGCQQVFYCTKGCQRPLESEWTRKQ